MKMKKVMAFALAGVMALSIAACGGGSSAGTSSGSGSGSADAGAASGALTINIWDANQQAGIQEICNDWTALGNPEVKVEVIDRYHKQKAPVLWYLLKNRKNKPSGFVDSLSI